MQAEKAIRHILAKLRSELPAELTYHNTQHTVDVIAASGKLAQMEGVSGNDLDILLTAAAYHDAGFLHVYEGHEKESCKLATKYLPEMDYSEPEVKSVCRLIISTLADASPDNLQEKVLCDADLDYLGREDFLPVANRLREEWENVKISYTDEEWLHFQLRFLEEHDYHTSSAKKLRNQGKQRNLLLLQKKLNRLRD